MALTQEQLRRYARHVSLAGVGAEGQEKLGQTRVLIIGAGGLGSASIAYLAAAGIGTLGIVDYDRVELSNLQRQILYETADIGRLKVESARDRAQELNPEVQIEMHPLRIDTDNAAALVRDYDIVADGCDNFATRFAVAAACHAEGKPLVSAAIRAFSGQLAVFKSYEGGEEPCYRCFVAGEPEDERNCRDTGVLGALTGIMGSLQALEVIKMRLGLGEPLTGKLILFDALSLETRIVRLRRDPACECCGAKPNPVAAMAESG